MGIIFEKITLNNKYHFIDFRISKSKIEYMHCQFSQDEESDVEVKVDGIVDINANNS